jgi:hypothetical protein
MNDNNAMASDTLIRCGCRRWSSVSFALFCDACTAVRCPHPSCTSEVAEVGFCSSCAYVASSYELSKQQAQ